MPSPFPGMDPFIEGPVWPDFHHRLITGVSYAMEDVIPDRYVVSAELRVYVETRRGERVAEMAPDSFLTVSGSAKTRSKSEKRRTNAAAELTLPTRKDVPVKAWSLVIRDVEEQVVVTTIEILSPTNNTRSGDGRRDYLAKRRLVLSSSSHLVEFDLLRGGTRLPMVEELPNGDYYAIVSRAERRPKAEVYAWSLRDRLPELPIPLADGDDDAMLDLQTVFDGVYDHARYRRRLKYDRSPTPPFKESDAAWAGELLRNATA